MKMLEDLFDIDANPIESIIGTRTYTKTPLADISKGGYISNAQWNKSTKTGSITLDAQTSQDEIRIDNNFVNVLKDYYISSIDCNGYNIDTFNTSKINPKVDLTIENCNEFVSRCSLENVTIKSNMLRAVENFNYKNCNIDAKDYVQISGNNYIEKYMLHSLRIPFINCKIKTKKLQAVFISSLQTEINEDSFYFEKTFNTKGWDVDIYVFYFVDFYSTTKIVATKNKNNTKEWFDYKKSKDNYYYRFSVD